MIPFGELIYDCTLREGMQSVYGPMFSHELRMETAERLSGIGIRKIELGSPAAGPRMRESIRLIADALPEGVESWVHIRCHPADLDTVPENVDAVGIYLGTSDLQMKYSHGKQEDDIISHASRVASAALARGLRVRFTAEDATRTPVERLVRIYRGVIERAAGEGGLYPQVIGIADTTGAATPQDVRRIVEKVRSALPDDVTIEFHGHNDRGFAAANAMSALFAGAGSLQVSLHGLGERNGIASLCDVVANLELDSPGSLAGMDRVLLVETAKWIERELGMAASYREPLSSAGYFADFAGVHANGSANNRAVYHIIDPALYGTGLLFPVNHPLVGRHAVYHAALALGLPATGPADGRVLEATASIKERSFRWSKDDPLMSAEEAHGLLREVFSRGDSR